MKTPVGLRPFRRSDWLGFSAWVVLAIVFLWMGPFIGSIVRAFAHMGFIHFRRLDYETASPPTHVILTWIGFLAAVIFLRHEQEHWRRREKVRDFRRRFYELVGESPPARRHYDARERCQKIIYQRFDALERRKIAIGGQREELLNQKGLTKEQFLKVCIEADCLMPALEEARRAIVEFRAVVRFFRFQVP